MHARLFQTATTATASNGGRTAPIGCASLAASSRPPGYCSTNGESTGSPSPTSSTPPVYGRARRPGEECRSDVADKHLRTARFHGRRARERSVESLLHGPFAESVLTSVGPHARLRLTTDHAAVLADGQHLSFMTVEVVEFGTHHWQAHQLAAQRLGRRILADHQPRAGLQRLLQAPQHRLRLSHLVVTHHN